MDRRMSGWTMYENYLQHQNILGHHWLVDFVASMTPSLTPQPPQSMVVQDRVFDGFTSCPCFEGLTSLLEPSSINPRRIIPLPLFFSSASNILQALSCQHYPASIILQASSCPYFSYCGFFCLRQQRFSFSIFISLLLK